MVKRLNGRRPFDLTIEPLNNLTNPASVPEKLLQVLASGLFACVRVCAKRPGAPDKLKILTIVGEVLLRHGIGAPFPTLMGNTGVVVDAIQTHFQIAAALVAALRPPGLAR